MPPKRASIAIVIPVYNKAPYITRAIDSALAQSQPAEEIIAVDDASTDGSAEILQNYRDRVRILERAAPGPGGYAARNLAIESTDCDWIAFLDADDWWRGDHLEHIRAAIVADASLDCVFTRYADHYGPGRSSAHPLSDLLIDAPSSSLAAETFLSAWLDRRDCPILTTASAFRRDSLIHAGLFPAGRAARGGDKDLWLRVMIRGRAAFVPHVTATFDRSATNKVTHNVSTAATPFICQTIARLLAETDNSHIARQLKALANQEIANYARQRFARGPIPHAMRQDLHMPEGWRDWIMLTGMSAVPLPTARLVRTALGRQVVQSSS